MKNFSTAALVLAFASVSFSTPTLAAAANAPTVQTTRCAFLANAPDQHQVVQGDTLWDIAGKFLQHPWCWPDVWGMNREQIRNPHWIYPGQIVYFDRVAGQLRLGTPAGGAPSDTSSNTVRLSPQVRLESMNSDQAISAIPPGLIEPFLTQPLIVEKNALQDTLRIVATQEGRVNIGNGDKAFAVGNLDSKTLFQAFRPGLPLKDPVTGEVIGYEAVYLGIVRLHKAGKEANEAHSLIVQQSKEEIGVGDRLLPMPPTPLLNYMPHLPVSPVDARIVSIYGGVTNAGQNQIIAINRGKASGLDLGAVLQLARFGKTIKDKGNNNAPIKLPEENYGSLFIFRVFDSISYGLVMQVTEPVQVGDLAQSPE